MTADHDKTENPPPSDVQVDVAAPAPMISRRMLLRGASAAVPTILTLNSGVAAAAAAASNMIAINPGAGVQTFEGRTGWMCVNTGAETVNSKMALREGTTVTYVIPDPTSTGIEYRKGINWGLGETKTPADMCSDGGQYMYKLGETKGTTIDLFRGGGMASAAALASFSSVVNLTDIF